MDADCSSVRATLASSGKRRGYRYQLFIHFCDFLTSLGLRLQSSPRQLVVVALQRDVDQLVAVDREQSFIRQLSISSSELFGINLHEDTSPMNCINSENRSR
jgi:hypothetical protein